MLTLHKHFSKALENCPRVESIEYIGRRVPTSTSSLSSVAQTIIFQKPKHGTRNVRQSSSLFRNSPRTASETWITYHPNMLELRSDALSINEKHGGSYPIKLLLADPNTIPKALETLLNWLNR